MSDFAERLAAADPVAATPYEHADLAAMTSRITAQSRATSRPLLRTFQLRVASAVAVATVVTLGAITALQSAGPSLAVLEIGTAGKFAVVSSAPASAMRINARIHFVAGPAISSAAGTASAFSLHVPADPVGEVTRIAKAFGVKGSPTERIGEVGTWDVRDSSGAIVSYESLSVPPRWTYSNGSSAPTLPPITPTSPGGVTLTPVRTASITAASRYLARLRFGYDLGRPTLTWTSDPNLPLAAQPPLDRQVITFTVQVQGVATDQIVVFMFDTAGKLLWASGRDFSVLASTDYPLSNPVQSVNTLNSEQTLPTTQGTSPHHQTSVTLMSEVLSLRTFQLTSGADWMLPTYVFSQILGGPSSKWWIVALAPAFLKADSTTLSGLLSNGPINY